MSVSDLATAVILRLTQALMCSLPPRSIRFMGWLAGSLWYFGDGRRRRRVAENLRVAFGDSMRGPRARSLARQVFCSMARVPIEVLWFDRLAATARQMERRCTYHGEWPQPDDSGPAGILFSGHLGNWEFLLRAVRQRYGHVRGVARRIANPSVEELALRTRGGPDAIIPKHGAYRDLLRSLREDHWVYIVGDQNAGIYGLFVPFFGVPASTHESPARLALREQVPLDLVVALRRPGGDLHFDLHRERLPRPLSTEPRAQAVAALTGSLHACLEAWIRRTPEQYNFLHRRWKDRPQGEARNPRLPRYDHRGAGPTPA